MRCNHLLSLGLSIGVFMAAALASVVDRRVVGVASFTPGNFVSFQDCLSDSQITTAVRVLSHGKYADQQKAVALLKADAERSSACRTRVITRLVTAMDQPNLDLSRGTSQFFLWHYGTQLLGQLKATEALDLLIANFDLHDGSGFPLDHYPALGGVIDMGEIALPKLQTVLRENPDPYTRRHTVFCIALIGGQSAHQILWQSLERETDPCVASCIRASLTAFANKRRPHHIPAESRTRWYTTFLCNGE